MLAAGHRAAAPVFVLSGALAADWLSGALAGAEHPTWGHSDPLQVLAAAVLAIPFSAGKLSPDADLTWLKRLGHRGAAHWPGWPVLAVLATLALWHAAGQPGLPLVLIAPELGWGSHLAADWWFGAGGRSIPRGIPLLPVRRGPRTGLGNRVSAKRSGLEKALIGSRRRHSVLEWTVTCALVPTAAGLAWLYLAQAGAG